MRGDKGLEKSTAFPRDQCTTERAKKCGRNS